MVELNKLYLRHCDVTAYRYRTAKVGCLLSWRAETDAEMEEFSSLRVELCKMSRQEWDGNSLNPCQGVRPDNHQCFKVDGEDGTLYLMFTDSTLRVGDAILCQRW